MLAWPIPETTAYAIGFARVKGTDAPEQTRIHDIRLRVFRLMGLQNRPLAVGGNTYWVTTYWGGISMRLLSPIRPNNFSKWTHWDLSPGPSACEADVIPLHHAPVRVISSASFVPRIVEQSCCVLRPFNIAIFKSRRLDRTCDSLAAWSKALASGASPQGRGLEPHSCHRFPGRCHEQRDINATRATLNDNPLHPTIGPAQALF